MILDGVEAGLIGELHPRVLQEWGLGNSVAAFELDMDKVRRLKERV